MRKRSDGDIFNLGSGNVYSVKEVIEAMKKVIGHPITPEVKEGRVGELVALIALSEKAKNALD